MKAKSVKQINQRGREGGGGGERERERERESLAIQSSKLTGRIS